MSRIKLALILSVLTGVTSADSVADDVVNSSAESSADFLQSVISRMQNDKYITSGEVFGDEIRPPLAPHHHNVIDEEKTPPLSKGELLALYQAAVTKGSGLNLSALPPLPLAAENNHDNEEPVTPSDQGILNGYYYYFYPIKSFLPNSSNELGITAMNMMADSGHMMNVTGHDMMMMMGDDNMMMDKAMNLDPLFLAMAGFVGVATIISVSILFLPKFGDDRSWRKAALKTVSEEEDDMFSLTQVIGQAIQGKDCADRLACELGQTIRNMKLGQKPLRVLEAMLPPPLAKQMSQVRQHMVKRDRCQLIPCKQRNKPNNNNKKLPKPFPPKHQ